MLTYLYMLRLSKNLRFDPEKTVLMNGSKYHQIQMVSINSELRGFLMFLHK